VFRKRFLLGGHFAGAAVFLLLTTPVFAQGGPLENTVRSLARRILPVIQGSQAKTCLDWQNRGALPEALSMQLRLAFLGELRSLPISSMQDSRPCDFRVLIQRTPTHFVFAAQIATGEAGRVLIGQIPHDEVAPLAVSGPGLHLQKELLWQQNDRIFDALQIPESSGESGSVVVLSRDAVSLLRKESTDWKLQRSWPLADSPADQRAPRGELQLAPDHAGFVRIVFPGKICEFDPGGSAPPVCQIRSEAWRGPIQIRSQCGSATWDLRAGSGDWSVPDRITLIDPSLPKEQAPLAEMSLSGPVLSLSGSDAAQDVTAVVFNLATGNYEVYAITLDCTN
jgi:hypothetical protein